MRSKANYGIFASVLSIFFILISIPSISALEENGVIEMPFTNNPPSIDGKWTTKSEWNDATIVNLNKDQHEVFLLVKHDRDFIYFMFDAITDQIKYEEGKESAHETYLMFDTNNDGGNTRQTDDFRFFFGEYFRSNGEPYNEYKFLNKLSVGDPGGDDEHTGRHINTPRNFQYEFSFSSLNSQFEAGRDHYIHEYRIPIAFLHESDVYGFAAGYRLGTITDEADNLIFITWPPTLQKSSIPNQFGNLVSPENKITIPPIPVLSVSVKELSFGNVGVSEKSFPKSVTISNKGTGLLKVNTIRGSPEFTISNIKTPLELQPGQSASFDAIFAPIYIGDKSGKITITSNDLTSPTLTISVDGQGAEKGSTLTGGGGCLIATATFGSELAPQVQQLRELRDNTILETKSGTNFMTSFNEFYYSFSPVIADLERENPAFKELVKITITPMLSTLSILNYVDINSESEMLGYGIGIIMLNIGMYFGIPAVAIIGLRKTR